MEIYIWFLLVNKWGTNDSDWMWEVKAKIESKMTLIWG